MSWHNELETEEFQNENLEADGVRNLPNTSEIIARIRSFRANRAGGGDVGCNSGKCCGGTCHG